MKIVCGTLILKPIGGRKHSLNLVEPGQGQRPPVFLYYTIYMHRFENIIHISVYSKKTQKSNIY